MGTTKKLYYEDAYRSQFNAVVTACTGTRYKGRDAYDITLDSTAFFPEEGGQSCDEGRIIANVDFIEVLYVFLEDDEIHHIVEYPIEVGTTVTGVVDFEKRYDKMQQHSGEHILCGIIYRKFGFDNVGFHLGDDMVTFDINGTFSDEDIIWIEDEANAVVFSNLECRTYFPTNEELDLIAYRSKFDDEEPIEGRRDISKRIARPENVRLVEFVGVDICACCAPHVARTGEIGMIKIIAAEHFRGGTRFTMMCGMRALRHMRQLESEEQSIMHLLSAKPSEVVNSVYKLKDDFDYARATIYSREKSIAAYLGDHVIDKNLPIIFCQEMNQDIARETVNVVCRTTGKDFCYFFTGEDDKYKFIIGSTKCDCREHLKELAKELTIKGGGSETMVMGTVNADEEFIRQVIERVSFNKLPVKVILASGSPRRREILSRTGIPFTVMVSDIDENIESDSPVSLVKELAGLKGEDVFSKACELYRGAERTIVISADTVVDVDGKVYGKPADTAEAEVMITKIQGRSHKVHTGVSIIVADKGERTKDWLFSVTSTVNVRPMTPEQIHAYAATGEPLDKAGAYAIQGLFAPYIDSIEGDYYNIVGLPIGDTYEKLVTLL